MSVHPTSASFPQVDTLPHAFPHACLPAAMLLGFGGFFFPFQILAKESMPNARVSIFVCRVALQMWKCELSFDSACYLKEKKWDVSGCADLYAWECALGLGPGELKEMIKGIWSGGTSQEPWDISNNLFSLGREVFEGTAVQNSS